MTGGAHLSNAGWLRSYTIAYLIFIFPTFNMIHGNEDIAMFQFVGNPFFCFFYVFFSDIDSYVISS